MGFNLIFTLAIMFRLKAKTKRSNMSENKKEGAAIPFAR